MAVRSTPGLGKGSDRNVSPVNRVIENVTKYAGNIGKEIKDYQNSEKVRSTYSFRGSNYPPNEMAVGGKGREYYQEKANIALGNRDKAVGQLVGSVFGRKYNSKGKRV